jgi:hypothetical protein
MAPSLPAAGPRHQSPAGGPAQRSGRGAEAGAERDRPDPTRSGVSSPAFGTVSALPKLKHPHRHLPTTNHEYPCRVRKGGYTAAAAIGRNPLFLPWGRHPPASG